MPNPGGGHKRLCVHRYEAMLDLKLVHLVLWSESVLLFSHTHWCSVWSEHAKHELGSDSIYPLQAPVERRWRGWKNKVALRNLNRKWEPKLNLMPVNLKGDWGSFWLVCLLCREARNGFWRGGVRQESALLSSNCVPVSVRRLTEKVSVSTARQCTKTAFRSHLPHLFFLLTLPSPLPYLCLSVKFL